MNMNWTISRRAVVRLLVALLLASAGGAGLAAIQNTPWREHAYRHEARVKVERVRKADGLHAAARASGVSHYVSHVDLDPDVLAANLEALTDASELIIRGLVKDNRTRLSRKHSGTETIVTDYVVQVFDVQKGPNRLVGKDITITIPGGRFRFTDNTTAEVVTPGFRRPLPQEEFVLFLRPLKGGQSFQLAWGSQGVFKLEPDGSVNARASATAPVSMEARQAKRLEFAGKIQEAIERNKLMRERRQR